MSVSYVPTTNEQIAIAAKGEKLMYLSAFREKFISLLARINARLGGKPENLPSDEVLELMISHAKQNWGMFTIEEIELSVILNIEFKYNEHIQFFGNLSVQYISTCLYKYNQLRGKALFSERQRHDALAQPQTHLSDEENNELLYDGMVKFVNEQHRLPEFWNFTAVFYHMQDTGKLDHWDNLRKADLRSQVEAEMNANRQRNRKLAISLDERRANTGEVPEEDIREECRKRVVLAELTKLLEIKNPDYLSGEESAT